MLCTCLCNEIDKSIALFRTNVPFAASEHVCSETKLDSYEASHSWVDNRGGAGSEERGRETVGRVGGSQAR